MSDQKRGPGRPPLDPSDRKAVPVLVRFTEGEAAELDRLRDTTPRASYLHWLFGCVCSDCGEVGCLDDDHTDVGEGRP